MDAPATVLGENVDIHILPNAMEDFHDPRKVMHCIFVLITIVLILRTVDMDEAFS